MKRKVRIYSGKRDTDRFPVDDDALLRSLMTQMLAVLDRGLPRPVVLVIKDDQVIQYDLPGLLGSHKSLQHPIMGAVAGQVGVECMALVGVLRMQRGRQKTRLRTATVYIEWPDNRWAMCWQPLSPDRGLVGNEPVWRFASEGWPRPAGLGGWFARSRREQLRLRVHSPDTDGRVH